MTFNELRALDAQYVAGTYARSPLAVKCGHGATCEDFDGKEYIDFSSGIGVNSLGFADPDWVRAVSEQAAAFSHICNLYYTLPGVLVAEALCKRTGMKKVFFANSGAEANEGAIKTARKYAQDHFGPERYEIVTLRNSFHGRTVTTLAATGQDAMHTHFDPFTEGFVYAKANDTEDVKAKISEKTCAVMLELIQGEGGVIPLEQAFVREVAALCRERELLLIIDEVQTGIGRTGTLYCYQQFGITPDLVTSAKGLGAGLPIGAVLFGEKTADTLGLGDHGTTFGMNPVVCAGAKVVLDKLDDAALAAVTAKGKTISERVSRCENVASVTGMGLMIGILPKKGSSKEIAAACLKKGLIVLTAKEKIRLLPPLTISDAELEAGVGLLLEALEEAGA
ncbi:MAG: acetylornithine/succinylornithine family transaminase [Oscillospiraceae bacterium]